MKRHLYKFLIFALICLLLTALAGCRLSDRAPTRGEVIPTRLGEQEGLWLYYENTRSRTDGTEKQEILQTVEYGGTVYTAEEFQIDSLAYLTGINEIVYAVTLPEAQLLYRYNYKHKSGALLYTLPEVYGNIRMQSSDSYLYVKASGLGILYDCFLNLIGTDFENFNLNNDILYRCEKGENKYSLDWYINGGRHTAVLEHTSASEKYGYVLERAGDYMYIFPSDGYTLFCRQYINLITGEQGEVNKTFEDRYVLQDELYVIISDSSEYKLYKIEGSSLTELYAFGETDGTERFPVTISCLYMDGDNKTPILYIKAKYYKYNNGFNSRHYTSYFVMYTDNYVSQLHDPNEIRAFKRMESNRPDLFILTVGGYTFYQNQAHYSNDILSNGHECYYLYRISKHGLREVMQYTLTEWWDDEDYSRVKQSGGRCFYNDICEF